MTNNGQVNVTCRFIRRLEVDVTATLSEIIHRVSEKKLNPLLFYYIFALTAANCMKIYFRSLLLFRVK